MRTMVAAGSHRYRARLDESIASYDAAPSVFAERYAALDPTPYIEQLSVHVDLTEHPRLLDVGCGSGRDAAALSARGARVVGLDLSLAMIEWSHKSVPNAGFVRGDALYLPFARGSFQIVWSLASLVHLDSVQTVRALEEINRVLVDDGVLFLSVPWGLESDWREDSPEHRRWFRYFRSTEEVIGLLKCAGFHDSVLEDAPGATAGRWITGLSRKSRA